MRKILDCKIDLNNVSKSRLKNRNKRWVKKLTLEEADITGSRSDEDAMVWDYPPTRFVLFKDGIYLSNANRNASLTNSQIMHRAKIVRKMLREEFNALEV